MCECVCVGTGVRNKLIIQKTRRDACNFSTGKSATRSGRMFSIINIFFLLLFSSLVSSFFLFFLAPFSLFHFSWFSFRNLFVLFRWFFDIHTFNSTHTATMVIRRRRKKTKQKTNTRNNLFLLFSFFFISWRYCTRTKITDTPKNENRICCVTLELELEHNCNKDTNRGDTKGSGG